MDEAAALRATIAAEPAADLPRLVYADWLEDGGDDAQATMIRAQVQLVHEPAWSPLAVRCRHHTPEVLTGKPWRHTLPEVSPRIAAWHPETPFRRGLPDWLVVRDLASFLDDAARLFALAPITTLSLPTSSLGYWQDFARQPWLRQVRALHFYGVSTPIEPLRVLANAVNASAVEELTLERTSGPAFPVVLNDLFQSDLGKRLKRLDLRAGGDNDGEWVEALEALPERHPLESLELRTMELGQRGVSRLTLSPVYRNLRRFQYAHHRLHVPSLRTLLRRGTHRAFEDLNFTGVLADHDSAKVVAGSPVSGELKRFDLSLNPLNRLEGWGESHWFKGLKSLSLRDCMLDIHALQEVMAMSCWPNLTELDFRRNPIPNLAFESLLRVDPPIDLTAIVLTRRRNPQLGLRLQEKLQAHFRGAVVFAGES